MTTPLHSSTPAAASRPLGRPAARSAASASTGSSTGSSTSPSAAPATPPRDRIVRFGASDGLAGILTTSRTPRPDAPHIVFVNAGIVHRVGPNRLYVDMARALAALGYSVLRFDLAGLGDSAATSSNAYGATSSSDAGLADIRAALDFLQASRGATTFLLFGLCSGANLSLLTAFTDARVVGAMLIDPTTTRTWRGKMIHAARRLLHAATWGSLLTLRHPLWHRSLGTLRSVAMARVADEQSRQQPRLDAEAPRETQVRASLQALVDRGVALMMVFTGGVNHIYNYRRQLFDLLPGFDFRGLLRLEYMPATDHTVSDGPSREQLLEAVSEWLTTAFPGSARSTELSA